MVATCPTSATVSMPASRSRSPPTPNTSRSGTEARSRPVGAGHAPAEAPAALAEVDRQVGAALEEAELALALHGDAARGHVGDAAVGEAEPRIRDVDRGGEDRDAHRLDRAQRRRH